MHRGTLNHHLDPRRGWKGRLLRPFRSGMLRLFHAHHYGGIYSRRVLREARISEEAMFFVPYSVDSPFFVKTADEQEAQTASVELRSRLGFSATDPVVLYVGQLNWIKGPDIAMRVLAQTQQAVPGLRALIVGDGRMSGEMRARAERSLSPGSYHFAGFVASKALVPYYLASDLVITGRSARQRAHKVEIPDELNRFRRSLRLNQGDHLGHELAKNQPVEGVKVIAKSLRGRIEAQPLDERAPLSGTCPPSDPGDSHRISRVDEGERPGHVAILGHLVIPGVRDNEYRGSAQVEPPADCLCQRADGPVDEEHPIQ